MCPNRCIRSISILFTDEQTHTHTHRQTEIKNITLPRFRGGVTIFNCRFWSYLGVFKVDAFWRFLRILLSASYKLVSSSLFLKINNIFISCSGAWKILRFPTISTEFIVYWKTKLLYFVTSKLNIAMSSRIDTRVIQVTNVAPATTKDQLKTLFQFIGRIREIKLFPPE